MSHNSILFMRISTCLGGNNNIKAKKIGNAI